MRVMNQALAVGLDFPGGPPPTPATATPKVVCPAAAAGQGAGPAPPGQPRLDLAPSHGGFLGPRGHWSVRAGVHGRLPGALADAGAAPGLLDTEAGLLIGAGVAHFRPGPPRGADDGRKQRRRCGDADAAGRRGAPAPGCVREPQADCGGAEAAELPGARRRTARGGACTSRVSAQPAGRRGAWAGGLLLRLRLANGQAGDRVA